MVVLAVGLLLVSLFGRILGVALLGEYLLLRRVSSWILSGAQLGLGVGLPRYVAHAAGKKSVESQAYFLAALACLGTLSLLLGIILNTSRHTFAYWLFGSGAFQHLIPPLSFLLTGMVVHACVYGYFRGCLFMGRANLLTICNFVIAPVAALLLLTRWHSVALIVNVIGISMAISSLVFALPVLAQLARAGSVRFSQHAIELLNYGVRRVPGDVAGSAIFAIGPIIAAHYVPMVRVSTLLLGVSLLAVTGVAFGPVGLLLLSKVSMMLAQDRISEVRVRLGHFLAALLELSLFICLQIMVFADLLVRIWVGHSLDGGPLTIRILMVAVPFYIVNVALQSSIDAASVTAYNARNEFVSLFTFLAFATVAVKAAPTGLLVESLAGALVAALAVLAWLTLRNVKHLFATQIRWISSVPMFLVNALLGGTSLFFYHSFGFPRSLLQLVAFELTITVLFLLTAKRLGCRWLPYFWSLTFLVGKQDVQVGRTDRDPALEVPV